MTLSERLAAAGHDEAELMKTEDGRFRLQQLARAFTEMDAQPPQPTGKDAKGADVSRGDTVTISYKVSATHHVLDPATGTNKKDVVLLNLDEILPDGSLMHAISVTSDKVVKA